MGTDVCSPDGWCSPPAVFDPDGMTVWGLLKIGLGPMGIAPLDQPTRVYFALPRGRSFGAKPRLRPDGSIIYAVADVTQGVSVRRWTWDALSFDGRFFEPPVDAHLNDPVIPTPACEPGHDLLVRAGTGELLYTCPIDDYEWFDGEGNLVVADRTVYSWLESGHMLVSPRPNNEILPLLVRTPQGREVPVPPVPYPWYPLLGNVFDQRRLDGQGRLVASYWIVDPDTGGLRAGVDRCSPLPDSNCVTFLRPHHRPRGERAVPRAAQLPDQPLDRAAPHRAVAPAPPRYPAARFCPRTMK